MTTKRPATSFKFRGGTFHALVVKPEVPIEAWLGDIDKLLARSHGFFAGKSVVIDVADLPLTKDAFLSLLDELSKRDIRILGVEGADPGQRVAFEPPCPGVDDGRVTAEGSRVQGAEFGVVDGEAGNQVERHARRLRGWFLATRSLPCR